MLFLIQMFTFSIAKISPLALCQTFNKEFQLRLQLPCVEFQFTAEDTTLPQTHIQELAIK
jgi:hypothetical protein